MVPRYTCLSLSLHSYTLCLYTRLPACQLLHLPPTLPAPTACHSRDLPCVVLKVQQGRGLQLIDALFTAAAAEAGVSPAEAPQQTEVTAWKTQQWMGLCFLSSSPEFQQSPFGSPQAARNHTQPAAQEDAAAVASSLSETAATAAKASEAAAAAAERAPAAMTKASAGKAVLEGAAVIKAADVQPTQVAAEANKHQTEVGAWQEQQSDEDEWDLNPIDV